MLKTRIVVKLGMMLCVLFFALPASARVSGVCSNCHTMHNSQDGSAVDVGGPSANLLSTDCVGCHSNTTDATTIVTVGTTRIPIVYNTNPPTNPLAGGNFYWIAHAGGDAYGHNVYGISGVDGDLAYAPGPSTFGCTNCHETLSTADEENGCKGCHVPRHHADDSATVVGSAGGWYRFLGDNPAMQMGPSPPDTGVIGIEEEDWEQNPSSSNHNVYQGTTDVYEKSFMPYSPHNTIGQFCAGCHGNFHHDMNTAQPGDVSGAWIRHPSDVVIPFEGEYASAFGATAIDDGVYNPMAPVAKSTALVAGDANFANVTLDSDVVTCISCHRPHGSPYPDMLRWDYANDCDAGTANADCGCFSCHTAKD